VSKRIKKITRWLRGGSEEKLGSGSASVPGLLLDSEDVVLQGISQPKFVDPITPQQSLAKETRTQLYRRYHMIRTSCTAFTRVRISILTDAIRTYGDLRNK
jgi:hypothetical protein